MTTSAGVAITPHEPITATVKAETLIAISDLPFVKMRLDLLRSGITDAIDKKRTQDQTVSLVRNWQTLISNLPMIRAQTVTCLEAIEGKGKNGSISFQVCDRAKFNNLQETIHNQVDQITALEEAMRELDSLKVGFLDELRAQRDSLSSVENQQREMLNAIAASVMQKNVNRRRPPEEVLATDQIYQDRKAKAEAQINHAKVALDELIPKIEKIEGILSSVGH